MPSEAPITGRSGIMGLHRIGNKFSQVSYAILDKISMLTTLDQLNATVRQVATISPTSLYIITNDSLLRESVIDTLIKNCCLWTGRNIEERSTTYYSKISSSIKYI